MKKIMMVKHHYIMHANVVKYLVEERADINKKNRCGKTPLDIAKERYNKAIVNYLITNN